MAEHVEIIVKLTDQVTPGAKKAAKGLEGLTKSSSGLEKTLGKLAKNFAIATVAFKAASFAKESVLLAARVETLGVVTKKLGENVGMTEREVRSLERAIVSQGITLQASRQSIAMMVQANVDLAHATDLARLAQDTAVIANLNSSEAFQQLVYVLQTGNVRMARTLGLNVQFGKAQKDLAKKLNKTTAELTDQQIMQARTNAVMKAGEKIAGTYEAAMGTAGKTILSMARPLEELSRIFGEAFLPILEPTVTGLYNLLTGITKVRQAMEEHEDQMIHEVGTYKEYYDEMLRLHGRVSAFSDEIYGLTEAEWNLERAMAEGERTIDSWNTAARDTGLIVGEAAEQVKALTEAQYYEAAAEAFIAGDTKAAMHFWALGEDARKAAEKIDGLIRAMMAAASMEGMTMGGWTMWEGIPEGDLPDFPAATTSRSIRANIQETASGGPLNREGWTLVGDPGPQEELISPWGYVFDSKTTKKLMESGLVPAKRAVAGWLGVGGGGGAGFTPPKDDYQSLATLFTPGGGGGISDTTSPAAAAIAQVVAVAKAAPAETAELVAAAIRPTVTQQVQQQLVAQARQAEAAARNEGLLTEILTVLKSQGTSDDIGDSMGEAMQFYDE